MSARAASLAPDALIDVFEHVPEYTGYDQPDTVKACESEYRISLGRVIKAWGDHLLEVAENTETPLSRQELQSIDAILSGIADLFDQLNRFQPTRVALAETVRRDRLRRADAMIIALMEESARIIRPLERQRVGTAWLSESADAMTASLDALVHGLERRNAVLLDGART